MRCESDATGDSRPSAAALAEDGERVARACLSNHISTNEGPFGVIGAEIYRKDIRLLKGLKPGVAQGGVSVKWKPARRGVIRELSARSRLRLLHTVRNTHVRFASMLTGTYPADFPLDGRAVKKHLERLLKALRTRFGEAVSYVWFLEFQRRGAPHFHLLLAHPPAPGDRRWLSSTWFRIVGSKDVRHLRAGTNFERLEKPDAAERYCAKYACKTHQKTVPDQFANVGRFWGASRDVKPVLVAKVSTSAEQVVERIGTEVVKFLAPSGKLRNYLWDHAGRMLDENAHN